MENHSDGLSSVIEDKLKERRKNAESIPFPFKRFNPDDYPGLEQGQSSFTLDKDK